MSASGQVDNSLALVIELRASALFAPLSLDELLPLARVATRHHHRGGSTVFEQGEAATHLYVVVKGRVEVARDGQPLAELGPGEHVGEMGVLDGSRRAASVRALTDVVLLRLARNDVHELMELYPMLALSVARVLSARLRAATALKIATAGGAAVGEGTEVADSEATAEVDHSTDRGG